ncbi:MAG: hypothetical protein SGARI_001700, partial [Bacillariaceae sp.]
TYDLPIFRAKQTQCLADRGCRVTSLNVAFDNKDAGDSKEEASEKLQTADIIVVGGGNTLYAMDRWTKLGLVPMIREAMERGAVLTGGSAGAIVWFDGGHSDSMDPDTYTKPMVEKYGNHGDSAATSTVADESSTLGETVKDWSYIRVDGLAFLPGLLCPHHDRVQSNGVLRARDFDEMMFRHPGETGIGIDHWAAFIVSGHSYRVLSLKGKPGSVMTSSSTGIEQAEFAVDEDGTANGVPGVWIKQVDVAQGTLVTSLCPPEGKLSQLLKVPSQIVQDEDTINLCRKANPSGLQ